MAEWLELAPCNTRVPNLNPARAALQNSNINTDLLIETAYPNCIMSVSPLCALHLCEYVWVTLCTPEKGCFSFSLYLHSHQGSTPSLPNIFTYPHYFLTAYKMTSQPSVLAGASD